MSTINLMAAAKNARAVAEDVGNDKMDSKAKFSIISIAGAIQMPTKKMRVIDLTFALEISNIHFKAR